VTFSTGSGLERATLEAAALIAQARGEETAERVEAATAVRVLAQRELLELAAEAEAEAARRGRRATERLPVVLEMIVAHARAHLVALMQTDGDEPQAALIAEAPR
jgi:hypothetical protein